MSFRRVLLTLHLWSALLACVFLLLLGATGSFMAYERELDHLLNRRLYAVQPIGDPLPLGTLFSRLEKTHPGYKVTAFAFPRQPGIAYEVFLDSSAGGEGQALTVNQYTGDVIGDMSTAGSFVNSVHQFHTHLLMNKHRDAAKLILGLASAFLLFLSCSGIILWWRRKIFTVTRNAGGKRINFDLHNLLGAVSSLFLLSFALTGVALTWDSATSALVNRITGSGPVLSRPTMPTAPKDATPLGPDALVSAARAALPGAEIDSFSMDPGGPVDLRMKFPEDRTPVGRSRVFLDPYSGKVLNILSTRTAPLGFKITRMWIREIHTGDIFGWPTRLLACVMSLILPIVVITGTLIWWNRDRKLFPPRPAD